MIGLGCTIGTGLFLGSAIAVRLAGPAVIVSFIGGAFVALNALRHLVEIFTGHAALFRQSVATTLTGIVGAMGSVPGPGPVAALAGHRCHYDRRC